MSKDYYKTLELDRSATEKDVKSAYRRLALKYHPDKNPGDKQAEELFKEVGEAYSVLSNGDKRRKYDQFGPDWEKYDRSNSGGNSSTASPFSYGYKKPTSAGASGQGFTDMFDSIFGTKPPRAANGGSRVNTTNSSSRVTVNSTSTEYGFRSRTTSSSSSTDRPTKGEEREQEIELTLEEAFNGINRQVQVNISERCAACNGIGLRNGQHCTTCMGVGSVTRLNKEEVKIPSGVQDGSRIRVPEQGGAGQGNGPRGDLYLKVKLISHPVFERKGNDLYTTVPVPLYNAILGGEVIVPSLKGGRFGLSLPNDTPNGKLFRLSAQGMPMLNQPGMRGDMYVRVEIVIPSNLSEEEKGLFKRLRDLRPS